MTKAYLTAGLPARDTSTPAAESMAAWLTAGLPADDLPHTGYRLYVTTGALAEADFSAPAMLIPAGKASDTYIAGDFDPSSCYTLVLRPVIDDIETPDLSCRFEFETDHAGQWLGMRPGAVETVSTEQLSGGRIDLSWTYRTPDDRISPQEFCIYYASGPSIAPGDPQAVISYERDGRAACILSLIGGKTYFFGVTARSADGVESYLSPIAGPVVADSSQPPQPPVILAATF